MVAQVVARALRINSSKVCTRPQQSRMVCCIALDASCMPRSAFNWSSVCSSLRGPRLEDIRAGTYVCCGVLGLSCSGRFFTCRSFVVCCPRGQPRAPLAAVVHQGDRIGAAVVCLLAPLARAGASLGVDRSRRGKTEIGPPLGLSQNPILVFTPNRYVSPFYFYYSDLG